MYVDQHPHGGASILRAVWDEVKCLPTEKIEQFASEFLNLTFEERNGAAQHVIGRQHICIPCLV